MSQFGHVSGPSDYAELYWRGVPGAHVFDFEAQYGQIRFDNASALAGQTAFGVFDQTASTGTLLDVRSGEVRLGHPTRWYLSNDPNGGPPPAVGAARVLQTADELLPWTPLFAPQRFTGFDVTFDTVGLAEIDFVGLRYNAPNAGVFSGPALLLLHSALLDVATRTPAGFSQIRSVDPTLGVNNPDGYGLSFRNLTRRPSGGVSFYTWTALRAGGVVGTPFANMNPAQGVHTFASYDFFGDGDGPLGNTARCVLIDHQWTVQQPSLRDFDLLEARYLSATAFRMRADGSFGVSLLTVPGGGVSLLNNTQPTFAQLTGDDSGYVMNPGIHGFYASPTQTEPLFGNAPANGVVPAPFNLLGGFYGVHDSLNDLGGGGNGGGATALMLRYSTGPSNSGNYVFSFVYVTPANAGPPVPGARLLFVL